MPAEVSCPSLNQPAPGTAECFPTWSTTASPALRAFFRPDPRVLKAQPHDLNSSGRRMLEIPVIRWPIFSHGRLNDI